MEHRRIVGLIVGIGLAMPVWSSADAAMLGPGSLFASGSAGRTPMLQAAAESAKDKAARQRKEAQDAARKKASADGARSKQKEQRASEGGKQKTNANADGARQREQQRAANAARLRAAADAARQRVTADAARQKAAADAARQRDQQQAANAARLKAEADFARQKAAADDARRRASTDPARPNPVLGTTLGTRSPLEGGCLPGQFKDAAGRCGALAATIPTCGAGQAYNRRSARCDYLPGNGPITPVVLGNGPPVRVFRDGDRPPSYGGTPWTLIGIAALPVAIAIITNGGRRFYADGYVDLPPEPRRCSGAISDACELRLVEVPRGNGGTGLVCMRYCPRPEGVDDDQLATTVRIPDRDPPGPVVPRGTPPVLTQIATTYIEPPARGTPSVLTLIATSYTEPPVRGTPPVPTLVAATYIEPPARGIPPVPTLIAAPSTEPPARGTPPVLTLVAATFIEPALQGTPPVLTLVAAPYTEPAAAKAP